MEYRSDPTPATTAIQRWRSEARRLGHAVVGWLCLALVVGSAPLAHARVTVMEGVGEPQMHADFRRWGTGAELLSTVKETSGKFADETTLLPLSASPRLRGKISLTPLFRAPRDEVAPGRFSSKVLAPRGPPAGRRTSKVVSNWTGSAWALAAETHFVYDGWQLLAELTAGNVVSNRYLWGLDLSGTPGGAGGIGGLLAADLATDTGRGVFSVCADGNGNVMALINATNGTVGAVYEYGPFGELLRASGPVARANPFRWSTKYQDDETGLSYYGYRYYTAADGRWWSRDPLGEAGGVNLYGFVGNDPLNGVDPWGLYELRYYGHASVSELPGSLIIPVHELEANRNLPASSSFTGLQQATGPPDDDWEMPLVDYPVAAVTRSLQTILRFPDGSISSTVNCPETCQSRQLSAQEIAATGAADISAFSLQTRSYPVIPASAELFERAAWVSVTWQSGAETLHYVQWEPRDFVGGEPSAALIFNLGISLTTARPGLLKPTSFSSVPRSVGNPTCATLDTAADDAARYLTVGPGAATRGSIFSGSWIKSDLFQELPALVGKADAKKFAAALKKGVVGPVGESGIKILREPVRGFTHELKIGGSAQRLLGRIDENGVLVFEQLVRGGLH